MALNWFPHVTVATVVCHQGKFLMVEEKIDDQLVINQPAGHLEDGESFIAAAIRETQEETGWLVDIHHLVGIYRWKNLGKNSTYLRFCFSGEIIQHVSENLDAAIQRVLWLPPAEIQQYTPRSPLVQRCIADYHANSRFPLALLAELDS